MSLAKIVNDVLVIPKNSCTLPAYYRFLHGLVRYLQPKNVLELGTGEGWSAMYMLLELPVFSRLTTINQWNPPSPDDVGEALDYFSGDMRLTILRGDTRDALVANVVPDDVDLLFIDTSHDYATIAAEWELYAQKLVDGAIVCVDDLFHNDMMRFWDALPYEKMLRPDLNESGFGIFQYRKET